MAMICPIMSYQKQGCFVSVDCKSACAWKDEKSERCLIALSLEANLKNQQKEMTFSDYANMMFINKERADNNE